MNHSTDLSRLSRGSGRLALVFAATSVVALLGIGCSSEPAVTPAEPTATPRVETPEQLPAEPQADASPVEEPEVPPATAPVVIPEEAAVPPVAEVEVAPTTQSAQDLARLRELNLESFDQVWQTVNERHYDASHNGIDWAAMRDAYRPKVAEAESVDEARGAMQEMINRLGQSHMTIIPGEAYEAFAGEEGSNGDGASGLEVRVTDAATAEVLVTQVEPGSGADSAGVKPGWQIVAIDGEPVKELIETVASGLTKRGHGKIETYGSFAVQRQLSGAIGQTLPVTFLDAEGEEQRVAIPLQTPAGEVTQLGHLPPMRVKLETRRLEHDGRELGYIAFNAFLDPPRVMKAISDAMLDYMDPADPVDGVILDVRGNVGGIVLMCPGIAGWFIDEQGLKLGTLTTREGIINLVVFPRPQTYEGPVAVLTDACSVSAAELLSGGFKSVGRGRVFGTATAGEALPSMFTRLPNGDGFLFVFADYVTGTGERLEGDGVVPDVKVPYDRKALLAGEDPMIEAAAEWIAAESADAVVEAPATSPAVAPATSPAAAPATRPREPMMP